MRITKVFVEKLFGVFDHTIPMQMDDRITIVHGPNGFGKTALLRMVNDVLNARAQALRSIPFRSLHIDFDNRAHLVVRKGQKSESGRHRASTAPLILEYVHGSSKERLELPTTVLREEVDFPLSMIERQVPDLSRSGPDTWFYQPTGEELSLGDVFDRFPDELPFYRPPASKLPDADWLAQIRTEIPTRFIQTQRLLTYAASRRPRPSPRGMVPAVVAYAEELATTIQQTLATYANLSQALDRTFPSRLVTSYVQRPGLPPADLRHALTELEEKRSRLVELGVLERERELDFRELQSIDERNRDVLSVYVVDATQKLSVFDDLSSKLELFKRSINERFLYKEMSFNSKSGFLFKTSDGNELAATKLSSGEQHELVMFFELLFKVSPNSLILIDEPELSLHVLWQQQFLKDLANITKLASFDVLLATHSPQIIHDRWDLTVELKGPADGPK